jgi:S-adenosylmethionine:tRNA-ribosyltransferase-isomerase (queuine synthetase)
MRFHLDPSGDPHIWDHNVTESEVVEALVDPLEAIRGRGTSVIAIGKTRSGRCLKVIYSPDDAGNGIFVVTAFDVPPKQIRALRKRMKRR